MNVIQSHESGVDYPSSIDQMTENYWRIFDVNLAWIRQSDNKAYTVFMIYGISISLAFANAQMVETLIVNSKLILSLAIVYLITSSIALLYGFRCIQPTLKRKFPSSIIFFGSIAHKYNTPEEYYEGSKKVVTDPVAVHRELCNQIYINSIIAKSKFEDIAKSITAFLVSLITLILIILISVV